MLGGLQTFQECQGASLDAMDPEKYRGLLDWSLPYPHPLGLKSLGTRQ